MRIQLIILTIMGALLILMAIFDKRPTVYPHLLPYLRVIAVLIGIVSILCGVTNYFGVFSLK